MIPLDKLRELESTKKAASLLEEFKNFALKGSVIDLAIGVIIGGALQGIIKSLVDNLFMPLLGLVLPSQQGYKAWEITVRGETIHFGLFLADLVNFLILAAVLYFFIVRFLGRVMRVRKEEAVPTKEQELLTEIRDLLKQQAKPT
jgi:large conductance mechanosensitive channel